MNTPPRLVLFSSLEKYLQALGDDYDKENVDLISSLYSKGYPPIVSIRALAVLFGYRSRFVGAMLKRPQNYYRAFEIKTGKKRRRIDAPRVSLKVIQKWFAHYLSRSIDLPEEVVGFVPGRSIVHGAAMHCGAKWIFSTDIRDFFQTTRVSTVKDALIEIGYPEHGAAIAANLSSLNGNLAQGSPASPVLSNLAFLVADRKVQQYCHDRGFVYSRYADDLVISGSANPSADIFADVKELVEIFDWRLSDEKTRMMRVPHRLKVYGLLVDQERPRLTKGYRRRLRAIRHLLESGRVSPQIDVEAYERARGHLAFAQSVENFSEATMTAESGIKTP